MITLPYDISCGYFDSTDFGNITESRKRKTTKFEIEFYLEDGKSTFTNGKEYKIKKHHIQIAKPNQIRYSYLHFKTMFLKFSVHGKIADKLINAPEYFSSSHPEKVINKLNEIILINENNNNEILLQSRMLSFINLILNDSEIPKLQSGQNYEIISKAKRFIENNFNKPLTLKEISHSVNLSPIYFHNIFTSACGKSPHDYLIDCRIAEAKKQLWNTDINLEIIAENCGLGSAQYFSRIFKKIVGVTPGKYRKEIQQNYLLD